MKKLYLFLIISVFRICIISQVSSKLSQECLNCICKASSGCDLKTKCHNSGPNAYFCGPYQISWAYWSDAGKPGNTGHSQDFENCLNDKNCAEVAVRGYMTKWEKDCNNDGIVDCLDYAAIHKAGASSCSEQWLFNSQYWNKFRQCHINNHGPSNERIPNSPQPRPVSNLEDKPWLRPQPYPAEPNPSTDPWDESPAESPPTRVQPTLESRPWSQPINRPQPIPSTYPVSQPKPQPDSYDPPEPQPQPIPDYSNEPETYPQNNPYAPETPQTSPYNRPQSQPDTYIPSDPKPDRTNEPIPYAPEQPQTRPYIRPQPQPQRQPQPDTYVQPLPQPDWSIPPITNSQPQPQPQNNPYSPAEPQPDPYSQPQPDTYEEPKPDTNSDTNGNSDPWIKPQSNPNVFSIPGRAPAQPISWSAGIPRSYQPISDQTQPLRGETPVDSGIKPLTPLEPIDTASYGSVEDNCLECICQASSDCDLKKQCEGNYCGPYLISWGYWSDGGKPGGDYASCATNKGCAERAVQGYMNKWQKDCNGDGVIDCSDFAAIHKLGPHSCDSDSILSTNYWTSYQSCKSPTIDARSDSISARSISTSVPTSNLFNETPNIGHHLIYNEPNNGPTDRINNNVRNNPNSPIDNPNLSVESNPVINNSPNSGLESGSIVRNEPNLSNNGLRVTPNPFSPTNSSNNRNAIAISRECMDCICHACSKCDPTIGCQNDGLGGYVCGSYQMNWAYWSDAGKPGLSSSSQNFDNFQSCLNNKECAEATIYGYMNKWQTDCNQDKLINCYDFAAIHKAGPSNCNAQSFLESQYWSDFRECFDFRRRK